MMDPDKTVPPHQPNTFRTWLPRWYEAAKDNPGVTIPLLTFMAGMLLGALVF